MTNNPKPSSLARLAEEIEACPVVDIHTHLRAEKPCADTLADVVLYHHVASELISAGLPPELIWKDELPHEVMAPDLSPEERVQNAIPHLHHIRNTTCGWLLRVLLEDLYGVPSGELTDSNVEEVLNEVNAQSRDPGWSRAVLRERCGIVKSVTVEDVHQVSPNDQFDLVWEVGDVYLTYGKLPPMENLAALEKRLGRDLGDGPTFTRALSEEVERALRRPLKAVALWPPADFTYVPDAERKVAEVFAAVRSGQGYGFEERSVVISTALQAILDVVEESSVKTIQLILGAQVKRPHRSIPRFGSEAMSALCDLFNLHPKLQFSVSSASDIHTQDIAIIAKHFPNVSVAGYWWHTLYPFYIKKSLEIRLDIVPANKIVAFFSDAYHAEWCYPKLKLVKRILTEVLAEKVEAGQYSERTALSLIEDLLCNNGREIYHLNE